MRANLFGVLMIGAALSAGCATGEEWTTWKDRPAHFASKEHMVFSIRNAGERPRVARQDIVVAREESWWGQAVTVGQDEILER